MSRAEIKIGGFGGQGVILTGLVLGKAAALFGGKNATMIQSFGPEARGSACSSQVVVADEEILYPYVRQPQVLVVMSQEAYTKFIGELAPDGVLLYEGDLVRLDEQVRRRASHGVPATRIAEGLGNRIVVNMVMLGFVTAVTGLLSEEAVRDAVRSSVPRGTEELNLLAFSRGVDYGQACLERVQSSQIPAPGS
jgi:2-oxoglutarate ferredoxin oxidoreductase subunit gamma